MTGAEKASKYLFICSLLAAVTALSAWCHGGLSDRLVIVLNVLIPASFLGLGIMIKHGDQACDADICSKRSSPILALAGGIWLGSLMSVGPGTATIFAGLLFALLLAGKPDHPALRAGLGVALLIFIASLLPGLGIPDAGGAPAVLVLCTIGLLPPFMYFFASPAFDLGSSAVEVFVPRRGVPSLG